MSRLVAFARFWYDFVVGDDWRIALGVVVAIAVTAALSHASVPVWWLLPAASLGLLAASLWRATRRSP